jgi:glycosyltransferase involved in cell wall biosynthesis
MKELHPFLEPETGEEGKPRHFAILHKSGQPLLYLPEDRALIDATLRLYPAQTWLARALVRGVSGFARLGWLIPSERATITVGQTSVLGAFLKKLVPDSDEVPRFGILGGNTRVPGRRYTILVFDPAGKPAAVVKVGLTPRGKELIEREQDLFFPQAPRYRGLPEAISMHRCVEFFAIAYRYVEGISPTAPHEEELATVLSSWVSDEGPVALRELPIWPELEVLRREAPGLEPVFQLLQDTPARPVLFHGDFTPWNIRVRPPGERGEWVILDWERSRKGGIPGWDWFHYIVHYNTMVRRTAPETTLADLEILWESPIFLKYAQQAGVEKLLKELALIYLHYLLRYSTPHDRSEAVHVLAEKIRKKHFGELELKRPTLKISTVTPSYKQLPWLKLCIASVADQKAVEVEHIIQDAQSGPELEEWVRENSMARLYVEGDSGMYDAINRGFTRATGDIVCWLNSDEQYLEGALAKVVRYFEEHPEVDVVFGDALLIGNNGDLLSYRRTVFPNANHIQLAHLNVLSCATFVRRSVLERGFLLETRWRAIADAVWVVSMVKGGIRMGLLNEPLAVFTITDKNLGQSSLAYKETEQWQEETSLGMRWFRLGFIMRHRLSKLIHGAYWPRSVSERFFTLSSGNHRVRRTVSFLGFKWPHKL